MDGKAEAIPGSGTREKKKSNFLIELQTMGIGPSTWEKTKEVIILLFNFYHECDREILITLQFR